MKAYLAKSFIGILVTDEQGKVILYRKFPKDPKKIIKLLESTELEKKLIGELKEKGYGEVIAEYGVEGAKVEFPNVAGVVLRRDLENIAIKNGFVKSKKELRKLLQKVAISICAERFRKLPRDRVAIQVIEAIEDLTKIYNLLYERLVEWYGLYYPTAARQVKNLDKFIDGILHDRFERDELGLEFNEKDIAYVKQYAELASNVRKTIKDLTEYLEDVMNEVAPNITKLIGAKLGAKLLSAAGSLEKLARMPASTIQVLGAEKALFRHLRTGAKPPKHGIIFQYPEIRSAGRKERGKIARALACKLSIAARADYFTHEDIGDKLKKELEERIKEIREEE